MAADTITIPTSNLWSPAGDFTIEAWINIDGLGDQNKTICARVSGDPNYMYFAIEGEKLIFRDVYPFPPSGLVVFAVSPYTGFTYSSFNHVAVTRTSDIYRFYVNGVAQVIAHPADPIDNTKSTALVLPLLARTVPLYIGSFHEDTDTYRLFGFLDEFRWSSISRYSANFTPSGPFSDDADTSLLLNFNGANGATSTVDSSSHAHPITFYNSAELATGKKKYGSASLKLNVTSPDTQSTARNDRMFLTYS